MLQLKERDVTPPGGWSYLPPGETVPIRGGDFGQLLSRALDYHVAHDLPTADLAAVVEDELCRRTGALCAPPRPVPASDGRSVTPGDVLRFLITMAAWLKNGTLVPQEKAERRAEICSGCKFNRDLTEGCYGCSGVAGRVLEIIGERRTRMDHALKNCQICSCFNAVQIWVPMPVLQKAGGDFDYAKIDTDGNGTKCWKAKD